MSTKAQVDPDIEAAEKAAANFYAIADRPDPKVLVMLLVLEARAVEAERYARISRYEQRSFERRAAELRRKAKELSA